VSTELLAAAISDCALLGIPCEASWEVKFPTLSRPKTAGQGWGTRRISIPFLIALDVIQEASQSAIVRDLRSDDFVKGGQQAVDFVCSIVVNHADAEEASGFLYVEVLGQVQGVVVAIPREESALA
jgi:hypothetical protein